MSFHTFDASYLDRLRDGDFRTMEHFVSYFSELMQLKLRCRLRSSQAIDDVRQETFTRFLAALRAGKIREPERLGAYVNSMCGNVLREWYRSAKRDSSEEEDGETHDYPDQKVDIFKDFATKETKEKVRETLAELSDRDRQILRAIFLEERDRDEVCREMDITRDNLRVLLHRAKLSFKSKYSNG